MTPTVQTILGRLDGFYRERLGIDGDVPLHEPWFRGNESAYVQECIDTGWVSSAGPFVDRLESALGSTCGPAHAVAVVNGTAALHITLRCLGVGADDAVICPALTFVATANAISYCGAVPIFADSDLETAGLDAAKLATFLADACDRGEHGVRHRDSGRRIGAIVPVHVFGHPVDLDPIIELGHSYGLPVIEDATESLGSRYHGRPCGALGTAGVLSFNGNKIITAGGGGAVLTRDEALARRIRHLTTTARRENGFRHDHDEVGFNYRIPNINAALCCAQLEQLDDFVARKRTLAGLYAELLGDIPGVSVFTECSWAKSNYWLNWVLLEDTDTRDALLGESNARGILARGCWRLLPDLAIYRDAPRTDDLSGARSIEARLVNLPSSPSLMPDDLMAEACAS